jgi:hypothetical protein
VDGQICLLVPFEIQRMQRDAFIDWRFENARRDFRAGILHRSRNRDLY